MIIDNVRLPVDIERDAQGGPLFNTAILTSDGGNETSLVNWVYPKMVWNIGYGIQSKADLKAVINMFYARRGRARGFLFKDWSDYEIANEEILIAAGGETTAQVFHIYSDDILEFARKITRPLLDATRGVVTVNDVILVYGSGAGKYTTSTTTGVITFGTALTALDSVKVTCEFDIPVRFDVDQLPIQMGWELVASIPNIPVIEVRD